MKRCNFCEIGDHGYCRGWWHGPILGHPIPCACSCDQAEAAREYLRQRDTP